MILWARIFQKKNITMRNAKQHIFCCLVPLLPVHLMTQPYLHESNSTYLKLLIVLLNCHLAMQHIFCCLLAFMSRIFDDTSFMSRNLGRAWFVYVKKITPCSAGLNPVAGCSGGLLHGCCWLQPKTAVSRPAKHGIQNHLRNHGTIAVTVSNVAFERTVRG